jgi:hypothetical protein
MGAETDPRLGEGRLDLLPDKYAYTWLLRVFTGVLRMTVCCNSQRRDVWAGHGWNISRQSEQIVI